MKLDELQREIKRRFPDLAALTDMEQKRLWGSDSAELLYLWFESFANVLNQQMAKGAGLDNYVAVAELIKHGLMVGDDEVKRCIDVSFIENLFWQVAPEKAALYWAVTLPSLQRLYVAFHRRTPC
ncbi:hypothetical protein EUZ85_23570 [Hahella sp. KA22]|uniref:DUF7674 family protein n=1 Tax=Hahella sp. KA22 TaxID=1628392 RepID=UPI000FDEEECD|nr:hypothetical protein [Hahella sp. KA22]AZZ93539.1 hypothetical protein ENC22_20985 [Hahella sp. KA22]QAY56914.1 hypothetical protein EUZ85_23570 [Hahella sp. KA22]